MSTRVKLNLLSMLGAKDEMQGFADILSVFPNKFNKFNNTRAGLQDSIYHGITFNSQFSHQNVKISPLENVTLLWTSA